ncbi:MAG TPA: adenylyltransferase/cytidyltransferase family protein [Candidatus Dojkabacteria bacterium]|nr:adenylyltransferase/cytidyltransferase family protein [Candidatus Dojkabacteria bacterium]
MGKITSESTARKLIKQNISILITGSFDVVHLGHLRLLQKAKTVVKGNGILIIALLDDQTIRLRKGSNRPIFDINYRLEFLSYLKPVDYVFAWKKPWQELRNFVLKTHPSYLAIVEGDPGFANKKELITKAGGKLVIIKKQGNFSTTKIINFLKIPEK